MYHILPDTKIKIDVWVVLFTVKNAFDIVFIQLASVRTPESPSIVAIAVSFNFFLYWCIVGSNMAE